MTFGLNQLRAGDIVKVIRLKYEHDWTKYQNWLSQKVDPAGKEAVLLDNELPEYDFNPKKPRIGPLLKHFTKFKSIRDTEGIFETDEPV